MYYEFVCPIFTLLGKKGITSYVQEALGTVEFEVTSFNTKDFTVVIKVL